MIDQEKVKYEPAVRRLTDNSFIALYQIVMAERERRLRRMVIEDPEKVRQLHQYRDDPAIRQKFLGDER